MTHSPYAIHWFRRDLRTAGNPALQASWKTYQGRVLGFFCFDPAFLARADFSINRFAFFLETLHRLREELRETGGDLLVLGEEGEGPEQSFARLLETLRERKIPFPEACGFNRDYEPFARTRDARIETLLTSRYGIEVKTYRDHLLIEPEEIKKDGSSAREGKGFYQVYSPFARKWLDLAHSPNIQERIRAQLPGLAHLERLSSGRAPQERLFSLTWSALFGMKSGELPETLVDRLEDFRQRTGARLNIPLPPAGSVAAFQRLKEFSRAALEDYSEARDFPDRDGTSRLSLYLKNGSLTTAQIIAALDLSQLTFKDPSGRAKFLKELVWREFYYHILFHCPRVEHEAFLTHYEKLEWRGTPAQLEAWKSGMTGYPIVDAGMRQLRQTGWMHNRVRMIVASFLTKDLLISWQSGERFFMETLLDGDLAPNNGGWQWAASTGCDPQPYFRIFNPKLQSERFDPHGDYIRRYVPELATLDSHSIHEPSNRRPHAYPAPIVDHARQKTQALALYASAQEKASPAARASDKLGVKYRHS